MKIVYKNQNKKALLKDKRVLKVVKRPQGKSYCNSINIQGKYLERFGFFTGDNVNISFEPGKITISKVMEEQTA